MKSQRLVGQQSNKIRIVPDTGTSHMCIVDCGPRTLNARPTISNSGSLILRDQRD